MQSPGRPGSFSSSTTELYMLGRIFKIQALVRMHKNTYVCEHTHIHTHSNTHKLKNRGGWGTPLHKCFKGERTPTGGAFVRGVNEVGNPHPKHTDPLSSYLLGWHLKETRRYLLLPGQRSGPNTRLLTRRWQARWFWHSSNTF